MHSSHRIAFACLVACLLGSLAVRSREPTKPEYVPGTEEDFPRLRYGDSQVSVNDRCPVRRAKLNPAIAPVYVNGRPVGFC